MAATTSPTPRWRSTTTARSPALQGQDHRQSRRLHVDLLVVGADLSLRDAAVGPVRHPGDLLRGRRGLHQHRAGRRLSRRRAAGGDLRGRAAGRGRRARDGHRSRRSCASKQLHQVVPAPDAGDHDLRRRRLSGLAEEGAGARRRTRASASASANRRAPASCAASAIRPTSRPAASRRRRRSARSAPASACGNPPRCGSIRPARSRC